MLKYSLLKNNLSTADKSPYIPKTYLGGTLDTNQTIEAMAYGSTATKADIKAILENMDRVIIEHVSQGRAVNIGCCTLRPVVKGGFQNPSEAFDPGKHSIGVAVTINPQLEKKVTLEARTMKIPFKKTQPTLYQVTNLSTGSENQIKEGDLLILTGESLKFDPMDLQQGVFLESNEGIQRVQTYSSVKSKEVTFLVPTGMETGKDYRLMVKSVFGSEIRTGELEATLQGG